MIFSSKFSARRSPILDLHSSFDKYFATTFTDKDFDTGHPKP